MCLAWINSPGSLVVVTEGVSGFYVRAGRDRKICWQVKLRFSHISTVTEPDILKLL